MRAQAAQSSDYDTAFAKLDQMVAQISEWRAALTEAKAGAGSPSKPEEAPQPPAESVEFTVNDTHIPEKCRRKSEPGATMKVHYVGKLITLKDGAIVNGKMFASSFHTGSQPHRFILGSDEVIAAWNQGLDGMCEGGRRRLLVPWELAYGEKGTKGVPPYHDVQFDFELVELSLPKIRSAKQEVKAAEEEAKQEAAAGTEKPKKKKGKKKAKTKSEL